MAETVHSAVRLEAKLSTPFLSTSQSMEWAEVYNMWVSVLWYSATLFHCQQLIAMSSFVPGAQRSEEASTLILWMQPPKNNCDTMLRRTNQVPICNQDVHGSKRQIP